MLPNRIKELRIARGLTVTELADRVGLSHTHISRIENGKRGLSIPIAEKVATAMGTSVADVIGTNSGVASLTPTPHGQLNEDAERYEPGSDEIPVRPVRGRNVDPWRIKTNALDQAGITKGMIVFVDISADAVENVEPLQCVVAQIYGVESATTIVRQFVPPSLLITNSSSDNAMPLDLNKGEAYIKGVIVGKYQGM